MALTQQQQTDILAAHNAYRSDPAVNTPALTWSSTLATSAQTWADNLATTVHDSQHSHTSGVGENLAQGGKGGFTVVQLVDTWGKTPAPAPAEKDDFQPGTYPNVAKDGISDNVSHYTQVIWRTTTSVGCGFASDSTNDYLVCQYSPAGNMAGVAVP